MALRRTSTRRLMVLGVVIPVVAIAALGLGVVLGAHQAAPTSVGGPIAQVNFAIPARVSTIPLVDQFGKRTDLAALRGHDVVLADFMTSCQEECPITTGALLEVRTALSAANLLKKVVIVEVSVDPTRDVPSRMLAYSKRFGVPFTFLTGTKANIAKLWKWFGVYYERVKEDTPPDINWQDGKPYTYDIVHTDDAFVIDAAGHERALVQSNANVHGKLTPALTSLLDADGRQDLEHPGFGSWTPKEMVRTIEDVLGRTTS